MKQHSNMATYQQFGARICFGASLLGVFAFMLALAVGMGPWWLHVAEALNIAIWGYWARQYWKDC